MLYIANCEAMGPVMHTEESPSLTIQQATLFLFCMHTKKFVFDVFVGGTRSLHHEMNIVIKVFWQTRRDVKFHPFVLPQLHFLPPVKKLKKQTQVPHQ